MIYKNVNKWHDLSIIFAILAILIAPVLPVSAGINFNYTNAEPHNYTITDSVLNSNNFVRLVGGDIEMPSLTLKFAINKTLVSGNKSLILNSSIFGPKTTSLPNQKVFYINPGGTATADYFVDASDTFAANMVVNVSTYKQLNGSVPFFSDQSATLLNNIDDLKNSWNNNSKVLDEFLSIIDDASRINETTVTLDSNGDSGQISQDLAPGRYLVMVTNGTDPKKIIAWNAIIVVPFNSSVIIGGGTGTATQGTDLIVNVSLNSTAPAEDYTYTTTIINRGDYADNLGNINITWGPGQTLAQATRINGTILNSADALTDIIPLSNSAKITTNSKSANMTLKTGALSPGSYLVNTLVFNSTNFSVVFNQSLLTLAPASSINITITSPDNNSVNDTGYVNVRVKLSISGTAMLNWQGVNESMLPAGTGTSFYKNKTGLLSGNYSFKVYANDPNGLFNVSETRIITVDRTIVTNISADIDPLTGNLSRTVNLSAPSGNVTLTIFNGTNATLNGTPITNITIDSLNQVNSTFVAHLGSNDKLIGENLSFGPEGARFIPDIQIRFNYTDAQLTAAGITASTLRIKFYNTTTNTWDVQTPYTLNETGKYITANVSHFSIFGMTGTTSTGGGGNNGGTSGGGGGFYPVKPTPAPTSTVAPTPTAAVTPPTTTPPQPAVSVVSTPAGSAQQGGTLTGIILGILGLALPSGEGGARNSVIIIALVAGILAVVAYRIYARRKR
ncbi:MAG: TIGR04279 domain-containing protein [Candidatus Methanoperedens sp.]|nr:TIGR04279 domain-containing protein [Candidatus Methanoperedens sp.]